MKSRFHLLCGAMLRLLIFAASCAGTHIGRADEPPAEHPPGLSPEEEVKKLKVAEGLEIGLVVAEPDVAQPLSISFDDRGRMWVLQYRQYPNPNGLKPVAMDEWLRTKYEKLPDPPPNGPKGQDRISVYEDLDGDGRTDRVKDFLTDLNLASGMALGYGGVFVVQPPYLLFYADRDQDDLPDGPPKVLLSGFGMEDAHAFANSLTWGADGWLYGAQGSTATAEIRGIGFQQGIWRYHPRWDRFELFSEGGGNTWGVEFDAFGNLFPAGNTVEPLEHHVQGAYLVKGFGKHGPLHNPHTYGYFQPVVHHGYVGDSLSGGAIIYQGGAFPSQYHGACICPHTRHSACRWCTVESLGSTFATRHGGDLVTSEDIWFRPVDMTTGPDGAVYIADWYDYNISHSSPKNRSEWYQPSRLDGRVWRVAPPGLAATRANQFDLSRKTSAELVKLLADPNDWFARQARRILAERCDASVLPELTRLVLESSDQRLALEGLWSIYVIGGLDTNLALTTLASSHEYVRSWTIRLLGDERTVPPAIQERLAYMAYQDPSVIVRSQLACTAKRLPASQAMPIVASLLQHGEDAEDTFQPLLIWWAIEDKAISDAPLVLRTMQSKDLWNQALMTRTIIERLSRRYMAEGTNASFAASAELLAHAQSTSHVDLVVNGMLQALAGRRLESAPAALEGAVGGMLRAAEVQPGVVELGLRLNMPDATQAALAAAADPSQNADQRLAIIKALGETRAEGVIDPLLNLLSGNVADPLATSIVGALGYFDDSRIAAELLARYASLPDAARARALEVLCSRPASAQALLDEIEGTRIAPAAVSFDLLRRLRQHDDEALAARIVKMFGRVQAATPLQKQGRINAVYQSLFRGTGEAANGREHFKKICANCHKLHGQGKSVGPDLTGAERKNRELLVRNIVDPSAVIRQEFIAQVAETKDGQILTGLLAESTAETITLVDAKNQRTVLNRGDVESLQESPISLMPDNLLDDLTEQQIRDLIAYVQSEADVPGTGGP